MDVIEKICDCWARGRNVLLYGPPGTGKTKALSELYRQLESGALPQSNQSVRDRAILRTTSQNSLVSVLEVNAASSMACPLQIEMKDAEVRTAIPMPAKVVWTTFHQAYTYEDFVLGLRPSRSDKELALEPWAGVFLDAVLELKDCSSPYQSVVIFIDEINRGNAARIFGEFVTFLDFDYREDGSIPIPVPLRQLKYQDGISETIYRMHGKGATVEEGFLFPKNIYVVASMNSVDCSALPIDSALARRFDRINIYPSSAVLRDYWKDDIGEEGDRDRILGAYDCALMLFERLNSVICSELGSEFELGHGLLMALLPGETGDEAWLALARVWDEVIYPQLEDRFAGRQDLLISLLKADNPPNAGTYAWRVRPNVLRSYGSGSLEPCRVSELDPEVISESFRWLVK